MRGTLVEKPQTQLWVCSSLARNYSRRRRVKTASCASWQGWRQPPDRQYLVVIGEMWWRSATIDCGVMRFKSFLLFLGFLSAGPFSRQWLAARRPSREVKRRHRCRSSVSMALPPSRRSCHAACRPVSGGRSSPITVSGPLHRLWGRHRRRLPGTTSSACSTAAASK